MSQHAFFLKWLSTLDERRFREELSHVKETDPRFDNVYFTEFIKMLPFSDIFGLKTRLLTSRDDLQHLAGILVHNTLKNLFLKDNADECFEEPTEEQTKRLKSQLEMLRKN